MGQELLPYLDTFSATSQLPHSLTSYRCDMLLRGMDHVRIASLQVELVQQAVSGLHLRIG
jgi:hypothetical protein